MKILMTCSKCLFDSEKQSPKPEFNLVNYDDELCEGKCSKGHVTYTRIQNDKYELLFDAAVMAFYDSYYRECVLNISSCLESFYEYAIKILLFIKKKEKMSDIEKFYKNIKSRSECREGVFQALSRIYLNKDYFLDDKNRSLRNNTIHNGYFPKEKETKEYINRVYEIIYDFFKSLKTNTQDLEFVDFGFAMQAKVFNKHSDKFYSNMYIPTILSESTITGNFEKDLESFKQRAGYCYNKKIWKIDRHF